ncbi:MAG TPA: TIGR03435 family protein [Bryobacteraceae bacterium]|nr:TIGR03435 family protein [Bryobacteraceae bacterium]
MKRYLVNILAALGIVVGVNAQTMVRPAFEVISVKPHNPNDTSRGATFLPGGRFRSVGLPLRFVIGQALGVGFQSVRLTGGPDWISSLSSVYDIEAIAASAAIPAGLSDAAREQQMRLMLQALLEDRFKLKIRRETKELPIYAVIVAKGGSKLEKAKIEEKDCPGSEVMGIACHTFNGGRGRGIHGAAVNMADVMPFVENWADRPMVDKTRLTGLFNIQTPGWAPFQPGPIPSPGAKAEDGSDLADVPTLAELFDKLGLRMESQKDKVEIYVIEHVEKPVEN